MELRTRATVAEIVGALRAREDVVERPPFSTALMVPVPIFDRVLMHVRRRELRLALVPASREELDPRFTDIRGVAGPIVHVWLEERDGETRITTGYQYRAPPPGGEGFLLLGLLLLPYTIVAAGFAVFYLLAVMWREAKIRDMNSAEARARLDGLLIDAAKANIHRSDTADPFRG